MLTEVFKGRKEELVKIANFLTEENHRFLCIWGPPGVGKSALLARTTQILRFTPGLRENMEGGSGWPFHKVRLIEYFIRRGATDTASQFFDSVNQRLDHLFKLRMEFGKSDTEKQALFHAPKLHWGITNVHVVVHNCQLPEHLVTLLFNKIGRVTNRVTIL